ncbi:hypothetical protein HDU80_008215, partial [Chytriomyces hyalinus]
MNASNAMLSIGLSWDVMGSTSSPQALIRVLLLKFFQNAMAFVTDSEIAFPHTYSARKSGRTNSAIYDGLANVAAENCKELDLNTLEQLKELVSAAFNNQVLMSRLDESVCFVKVRTPEQFVLVFLPRAASEGFHGSHLSITLLECSRARVHDTMSGKERLSSFGFDHCKGDHSEGHIKWSVKMKNLNEAANGSILVQSEVTNDSRASEKEMGFEVNPNEYIDLFVSTVSDAYAIAHCESVYAALVQSVGVSLQDVEKALFNCFEKTIDIDLTAYLNAITLTYQRMHSSRIRAERNRIVNSFQHIMSNKFRQLLTYAGNENCYFYNPDDSDEGATQMRIESADTPLFLKTEVIFKKVPGSQVETAVVPMTFLPTSYWIPVTKVEERHCDGSGAIDFRPLSIGNKENPLASNEGTVATLRISCLLLFQPKKLCGNNDDTFDNEMALDDPRLILSLEKIDALYDTVDEMKVFIENEVMNGLLDLPSAYEQFSMHYTRYCLSSRHQIPSKFSDREALQQFILFSSGVFDLPLEFVKNQHDTKHIMGESSKILIPNAMLSFNSFASLETFKLPSTQKNIHSFAKHLLKINKETKKLCQACMDWKELGAGLVQSRSCPNLSTRKQASGSVNGRQTGNMQPWLPSVIIQYTIKARISLDAQRAEKSILLCVLDKKKPRIELNILAHHAFALGFVNSSEGKPQNDRFGKLAMYLKGIREADSLLHLLASFNQKPVLCSIPKFDARLFPTSNNGSSVWNLGSQPMHSSSSSNTANSAADSANLWNVFCHFMINKSASFDDCDVDIILRSSNPNRVLSDVSPQSYPPSIFSNSSSRGGHARWALSNRDSRSRLPSALIHIMNHLANEWSLFALNRTTFVKLFHSSDAEGATSPNSAAAAASGLVVLRMVHETDRLLSMRLTFFNVPLQDQAPNPGTEYSPLRICEKPRFIVEYEGVDHTADIGTSTDDAADERPVLHQNHDDALHPTMNQTAAKSERTLKYATLISPVGPRSYLRSHRWIWLADVNVQETPVVNRSTLGQSMVSLKSADGGSASGSHLVSILDMALYLLYFARLEEGFLLLSHLQDSVTMYREISMEKPIQCLDGQGNAMNVDENGEIPMRRVTCGVQYIILIDRLERTVVTELWAEPVLGGDGNAVAGMNSNQDVQILFREMHDPLAKLIMESDSKLFEGLYTFERVHLIGRQGSDIPMDVMERSRGSTRRENLRSRATSVHSQRQGAVEEQAARLTSVELNEPGRKLSVMRTKYSIDGTLRKSKVSCIVYAAPTVTEIPAGVGVGLVSDDQQPLIQMFQFKSDGDLAASRNTSPGQALDSPRPCASTDHVSFYRRSSQATGINGGKQHMNASNAMLSIGLSWDVMGSTSSPQALMRVLLLKFFQNAMAFVTDSEIAFPQTYSARRSGRTNSAFHDDLGNVAAENCEELDFNTLKQLKELVPHSTIKFSCLGWTKAAASDAFHGSHLSITLLECSRARVHDTMSGKERLSSFGFDHCKDDNSEGHIKWSVKMKNLNEASNGSILVQSEVTNDSRASEKEMGFEVNPNEYIDLFVSTVSDAYAIAHCKSVYAALVQSVGVSLQDVEKALFNCFEKTIDIDLTAYLNAITLTYQRMHSSRMKAERNRIVNSFQHIMSNKFRQLLTYAGNENGYFYNPDDSDEGPTQLRIESADTPLFLKTEVIFKKVVGSQVETAVVPMTVFPTSYWVPVTEVGELHCYGSGAIDFRPLSIGNKENPLASNDGTVATLRISCLSLFQPKKLYGNNDDTFDNEIFQRALDDPRLILSLEKIDALYDTVDQIKALIENEVMNGLLDLPSAYEQFSMDYIRYCLSGRHQIPSKFSDREALQQFILSSTGVFDLPLEFVKNQHDTKHIMGEFSKIQIPNAMLSFTQLNEFFCITGNFQAAVNPKKHSFVRETFAENQQGNEKTMPGLRGLGISFRFCRKSWALVSFKADLARIWFVSRFTSEAEKLDLLSWIYDAIQDTCIAVNRLILLDLLKKTHRASKFLIKRAENDDSSDEDDEDEEHHYYTSHSFVPGQFACPLVSSHTFPIHWRLKPLNALSIATASINILGISNRNNMFVFEEDGKVVYFKLSVKEVELDQSHVSIEVNHPALDDVASSSEPLMMAKGSPKTSSPLIARKPVGLGSAHSVAPQKPAESVILLEFFGVDGSLNANEFVTIIETKLGGLVQKEIGTYISRNSATVRLTPADVEFILPVTKRPQRVECFKLPDFVLDKLGFMLLFKQALSAAFNALPSLEIGSALKARFEREYGISEQAQGDRMNEINFGEFAFFYNSVQSRSNSSFEISVGNGTALISIFVVNSKRNICQRFSHPTFAIARKNGTRWERNAHDYLRDHASELRIGDFDRCIHDDCKYAMAAEIWHYGPMNSEVLMDYVFKSFCNTISDYLTESSVRSLSETLKSNSSSQLPQLEISKASVDEPFKIHSALNLFIDQTMTRLALSAELKNAAVQELCSPIRLPRCIADEIASDTRDLLTEISSSFNPVPVERAQVPSGEPSLTMYSAKGCGSEESFQNRQILLVVGIPELSDLYGCDAEGKITPKSTTSSGSRTPTSTMHDMESSFTGAAHKNSISSRAGVSQNPFDLRRSVADGVQVYPRNLMLAGKEICSRSGFLMMLIDQSQISTATYNLNQAAYETIFNHLLQILSWNNIRMQFLESGRRGDSFGITPREKVDNLGVSAGIEHSSSYTGIGGLGHAAMSHFVANGMSETSLADKLKRLYNINENSLQRSAVAFLDSYVRSLSLDGRNHSPAEQWAEGIDTPRTSLVQANGSGDGGKLSTADLAALLRSIRLFFVHYPIFFSDLRTSMFKDDVNPPHNEDFSNASSTPIQKWFKETLVKFSTEYSNYLASLGFEPFKTPPSQTGDWEKPPTLYISNSATVEIDAAYLMKRITSGILFVQIGVEGVCIVVNLFMLKLPSNHLDPFHEGMRYVADSDADASFKHDCATNKEALHVHSFSYDFHIRYFQHILDNQQNCIIDILDVMKVFEKYNSDRFVYARSRILGGECISDDPAPSISLFQYILKNPHQYGFKSIVHNGHPTACFLTSEFQDFAKTASKSQFKSTGLSYTVVVYVSREQATEGASGSAETSLQLRYFLLIVDQENAFPLQGLEAHQEKLKEYLAGGCYFGDVAKFAEKKILTLMEQ